MNVQPTYETACIIDAFYVLLPDPHPLLASSQGNHYPEFLKKPFQLFFMQLPYIFPDNKHTIYFLVFQ